MQQRAVSIVGPTGVGKTGLALELAEKVGEIISVDSRQVYKYMDIGTAKPTPGQQNRVFHHMVDVVTPDVRFNAGDFVRSTKECLNIIWNKNKIPFLVGGTGLYFNALMYGLASIPSADKSITIRLESRLKQRGQEYLFSILKRVDPVYAAKISSNDRQRTMRALEVFFSSGKPFSAYHEEKHSSIDCDFIKICINMDRKELYERINRRVEMMLEEGLVAEVESLLAAGYQKDSPGLRTIGYKEIISYLDGECTLEEAASQIQQNSRRYAKRQLTWFRSMPDLTWFEAGRPDEIRQYLEKALHTSL